MNIERVYKVKDKLFDIYNSSHHFYNDIYFTFSSEINGKDVTLKDRRNEYYINLNFCEIEILIKIFVIKIYFSNFYQFILNLVKLGEIDEIIL